MTAPPAAASARAALTAYAYDGSRVDGGLYTSVTDWARTAPGWLDSAVTAWSRYGIALFAVLMVAAWWAARRRPAAVMARALLAPAVVVAAYLLDGVLKDQVREVRPCRQIPHSFTLEACPGPADWAFPSNHTVVAFAAAAVLLLASRGLGALALAAAVAMGASRVWVGAHYPHDVVVGAVVGVLVAVALAVPGARAAAPLVARARSGRLAFLLAAGEGTGAPARSGPA